MNETNPVIIMLINMSIVFTVLYVLSLCIRFVYLIDPTKKKKPKRQKKTGPKKIDTPLECEEDKFNVAIISAAIKAYGLEDFAIKSIRRIN